MPDGFASAVPAFSSAPGYSTYGGNKDVKTQRMYGQVRSGTKEDRSQLFGREINQIDVLSMKKRMKKVSCKQYEHLLTKYLKY